MAARGGEVHSCWKAVESTERRRGWQEEDVAGRVGGCKDWTKDPVNVGPKSWCREEDREAKNRPLGGSVEALMSSKLGSGKWLFLRGRGVTNKEYFIRKLSNVVNFGKMTCAGYATCVWGNHVAIIPQEDGLFEFRDRLFIG
jgi:hypothetical protein